MIQIRFVVMICLALSALSAGAQELTIKQRMLMPGPVIQGHAEFEAKCDSCHVEFEKGGLTKQCLDCHDEIREDRTTKKGFHGQSPQASTKTCNTCHTDHIGRDADIVGMQIDAFDHNWTRFPLKGKHQPLACKNCHEPGSKFRDAVPQCVNCHKEDDFHRGALGTECESCHTPEGWQNRLSFDHSTTNFPLFGAHTKVACSGCHAGQNYDFEDTNCVSCHKAADIHAGKNGKQCDTCHSVNGWDKLIFDHSKTQFPLQFKHAQLPCRACHQHGVVLEDNPLNCGGCHKNDDVHLGRNGDQCETCHQVSGWKKVIFDHAKETQFPLTGEHTRLACTQCHTGALTDPMPRDCAVCHAVDDPHKTEEMAICATCHTTNGWNIISRFDHHFTQFPLVGMHQVVACEHCHIGNQFVGTGTDCANCHKANDHHKGALGDQCQTCHNPNAWNLWSFDHFQHTGYELLGSHADVACDACHAPGTDPQNTPNVCGRCHERQDIHNGGFGSNCGKCHSQNKFFELILQE